MLRLVKRKCLKIAAITGRMYIHLHLSILSTWVDYVNWMNTFVLISSKKPVRGTARLVGIPSLGRIFFFFLFVFFSADKVRMVCNTMETLTQFPKANSVNSQVKYVLISSFKLGKTWSKAYETVCSL